MQEVTFKSATFFDDVAALPGKHVHMVMIATKPDIIKQVPLYKELKKRMHPVVLAHTGQHYSDNLSGGMLAEFGVEPDFNLNVRGESFEIVSQIIGRLGWVIKELKERGKIVIPYVHGDTTTAMAAANAGFAHGFAAVHVEAGIRTLTPDYGAFPIGSIAADPDGWRAFLADRAHWKRGSLEPYPEQCNTRAAEAGSGLHLAPHPLDVEFLRAEGFPEDRIVVTGNSVVDAVADSMKEAKNSTVFERFPVLAKGDFVRFCIHRRENCSSDARFGAIMDALRRLLEEGRTVLLISLFQTEKAIERMGLKDTLADWQKRYGHFVYTPVWPEYKDVMAAMSRAAVCATDSGSMQEEMNAMRIPCVTLRFGSDRSESAMAGGNVIAPPTDGSTIAALVRHAWNNEAFKKVEPIYGDDVSAKSIDAVERILATGDIFRSDEFRLGL
jgi:UDP-N-acetylglucosamine 2-epimerase (non-hydrolysing)